MTRITELITNQIEINKLWRNHMEDIRRFMRSLNRRENPEVFKACNNVEKR